MFGKTSGLTEITIPAANFSVINGGIFTVSLYQLDPTFLAFDNTTKVSKDYSA